MEKQIRYKNKDGKRFLITIHDNSHGLTCSLGFYAHEVDDDSAKSFELYFGITDTLRMIWRLDDNDLLYNFLFRRGLQLMKGKIDSNDRNKEVVVLKSDSAPRKFPYRIVGRDDIHIEDSKEKFRKNFLVQRDILGYLYSKSDNSASPKEVTDYVWCEDELLAENIFYLDRTELISSPPFTPKIANEDNGSNVIITVSGKKRYEEMIEEEALLFRRDQKFFEKWVPFASNKEIFIAHKFNEKVLIEQVKDEIVKAGFGWREGKVEDLGYITEDIINKIKECGFFFVLITPTKEYQLGGKYSTSSWLLMEIGVAIAYGRKCLILAEDAVDVDEFSGKLQRDVQHETFNRQKDFPDKLRITIARLKAEYQKQ